VIEVDRKKNIIWSYGCSMCTQLSGAAFASRLPNGDILITDSNNNRILEVAANGNVVFTYYTNTRAGSLSSPLPTRAVRLKTGNTLISDQFNDQVIEIDPSQNIVFTKATIPVGGDTFDLLNAPYDAKALATTPASLRRVAMTIAATMTTRTSGTEQWFSHLAGYPILPRALRRIFCVQETSASARWRAKLSDRGWLVHFDRF
jgi:hypothetical protein